MRIVAAFSARYGYLPATPEEGVEFVRQQVFAWLARETIAYESQQAAQAVLANPDDPLANAVVDLNAGGA